MRLLKFVLLMAISSLTAWSCKETVLQEESPQNTFTGVQALAAPQVNFAAVAPIAQDFIIQKLEKPDDLGNTLIFKAAFSRDERSLSNVQSFPIMANGRGILLRDDGRLGDEVAGDRVFSAFVKEDINRLGDNLKIRNSEIARTEQTITRFVGRSMLKTRVDLIDLDAFLANKPVSIGIDIATQAVVPDALKSIKANSLVITSLNVIQDPVRTYNPCVGGTAGGNPNGVWTFKKLMTNMANTASTVTSPTASVNADNFVKNWIETELFARKTIVSSGDVTTVTSVSGPLTIRDNLNDTTSPKRKLIAAWLKNSGLPITQNSIDTWQTQLVNKLEFFPVRLLAIVNRLDLRGNFGYTGNSNSGGEGRFVFCFMDSNKGCTSSNNGPGTMTIILEYGIPITNCSALQAYAQRWYNLKDLALGSATYNSTLEGITTVFTKAGANPNPSKPNGSALNHLRSNEFIKSPWNIRDFEILKDNVSNTNKLTLIHPDKEPMREANTAPGGLSTPLFAAKVTELVNFANSNVIPISNDQAYAITDPIKSVDAQIPSPSYFWNATTSAGTRINSDLARHKLSLNTCSGCHSGETGTFFTHIHPSNFNAPVTLSSFLTGPASDPTAQFFVTDPAGRPSGSPEIRGFNDLLRRANDLEALVNILCGRRGAVLDLAQTLRFQPLNTTD